MPINNPNRDLICPHCSQQIHLAACRIVATIPYQKLQPGTVLYEPKTGFLAHKKVISLTGQLYTRSGAVRCCPYCDRVLPHNFDQTENYTIAIIGDSMSGVSTYIGSLFYELREGKLLHMYSNILSGNVSQETEHIIYNEYFAPLFLNRLQLLGTQPGISPRPLIYELTIRPSLGEKSHQINLIFYDTAGEDIVDLQGLVQYAHYLFHASGIVFLADPLAIPGIRQYIPENLQAPPRPLGPAQILNRVLQKLRQGSTDMEQHFSLPLAITLSKADLVRSIPGFDQAISTFLTRVERYSPLESQELHIVDNEVRGIIRQFGDHALFGIAERYPNTTFCAVSATGCTEDKHGKYPFVTPLRCLDPLIWMLGKLGVIAAK